jgi:hypothetical protein
MTLGNAARAEPRQAIRELGLRQLANKFAMAEAQATKMLLGLMLERERLAAAASPDERPSFGPARRRAANEWFDHTRISGGSAQLQN